ncbi:BREX system P-loop protein BrxC [Acetivibrio mesophilus]|uniref:BREX system P-loop protein BrxC n=1 Tax=Acetivibrio mesophilus TaxID=2487273 RepID=A0A4Q0I0I0_9FIRM|nr:BREX system P-loop protein BrxC [Acetivibrio mesophilus]RXE57714.1 BREX system P-loop protein BrxC [Acetivibrio mesophilus]
MLIRNMFEKDITREIQGVIKVDQREEEIIYNDLEEYVVTRELYKHLDTFFSAYIKSINGRTDKMGCWISGFFGSGKSHFLKILSYLLKNVEVKGKKAVSFFDGKIDNPALLANMKLAGDISSDVILFNIDYKADSDSKLNKDAIVKVFMKVFNEMQGFCGSMPWVAEIEYQMSKEGTYEAFKNKFLELSGQIWEDARNDFYFEGDNIVQALADTTKMSAESARNWYEKCESTYNLSVEKFAQRVREYIESKPRNYHLIFLCDEIGQYIGDNTDLLLNLQTVVEALGTQCGGKAWVICTSQQDIDSIVKVKSDQFSKILGRFDTRLSLSSANVDEVIKRRLLDKKTAARETLELYFSDKEAILKNQLSFSADAAEMKIYKNSMDFAAVYPFVPYQFHLVQSIFNGIRLHGASGKHLSEGERSLLSGFQESAIKYLDKELGTLIPLQAFYDTIDKFLDHNIKIVIDRAERNDNLEKPFDIDVLKVLFMLKYVKELPANIDNLSAVMLSFVDEDKLVLKKKIDASLRRLEKQTLIQKNGDRYIFLTNEEQDINKEIQNISIDSGELIDKIGDEIFAGIYPDRKYKYSRYDFGFNQIIDDRSRGNQKEELTLRILTPYYSGDTTDTGLKLLSYHGNALVIKLPDDTSFIEEMERAMKIDAFLRRKSGVLATEEVELIKASKTAEIRTRRERSREQLIDALKKADMYALGNKLDIREKSVQERISEGFKVLVEGIYTKLGYIKKFIDTTSELAGLLMKDNRQMRLSNMPDGENPNKLAIEELTAFLTRNSERNIPTTVKTILDLYSKAPYGYRELDIQGLIAELLREQEIRLIYGSEYIEASNPQIINYLTKRDFVERVLVKIRTRVSSSLLNNVKTLAKELFNRTALPSDEDGLMVSFKELCQGEHDTIVDLLGEYKVASYPGKQVLEDGKKIFSEILKIKDSTEFFSRMAEVSDDLLDYEEKASDIKKFFAGNQREIFDKALKMLSLFEANRTYFTDSTIAVGIIKEIESIVESPMPYSQIIKLPDLVERFRVEFGVLLEKECEPVKKIIESDYSKVIKELDELSASEQLRAESKKEFENLLYRIDHANNMYEAIAMKTESDRLKIRLIEKINAEYKKRNASVGGTYSGTSTIGEDDKSPNSNYKTSRTINVTVNELFEETWIIRNDEDIDRLLGELKQKLKQKLTTDTVIKLL